LKSLQTDVFYSSSPAICSLFLYVYSQRDALSGLFKPYCDSSSTV